MINHVFVDKIGKTMEEYVDDMLVKFKQGVDLCRHLARVFVILQKS